jgi:hypothetical protein
MISKRVLFIAAALLVVSAASGMAATIDVNHFVVNKTIEIPNYETTIDTLNVGSYGIVHSGNAGASSYGDIQSLVANACDYGMWDLGGIMTSVSHTDGTKSLGLLSGAEYLNMSPTSATTFFGNSVSGSDTLLAVCWGGDINLDGTVNDDDLNQLLSFYSDAGSVPVTGYSQGDLNFDGVVNDDDLNYILGNYTDTGSIPYYNPPVAPPEGPVAVPEPTSLMLLAAGLAFGLFTVAKKRFF